MEAQPQPHPLEQDGQARHPGATATRQPLQALRHASLVDISATSSPLSSAPTTPALRMSQQQRNAQPASSPLQQRGRRSSRSPTLRRTSSAISMGQGQTSSSSPRLVRKDSRPLTSQAEEHERRLTPKRSISNLIAGLREAQSTMESIEEPIALTAPQIAIQHFTRELINHVHPDAMAEVIVILHDACYGHRYSRLKTTKSTLGMIVERPERIHASVLGASAAYVRLGEHCAGRRNAPRPEKSPSSPPPFKIRRTARSMDITSSCVTSVHGTAWMAELRAMCQAAGDKLTAGVKELGRATTPTDPEKRKLHEGDLYLCPESLDAFQGALGGVADAVDAVFLTSTRAFVAVRPPGHHCSADYPSGFCWLNNVHVGIEYAAQTYGLTHAAIIDFDLHHGDGSQAIAWDRNSNNNLKRWNAKANSKLKLSPDIGYFSLHDINSYPCESGDDSKVQAASLCVENAHGQSMWNIHLQPWKTESEFWQLYADRYCILLEKARVFLRHHTARVRSEGKVPPKAAVFISAGFDASEWESPGMQRHKVNVPTEFYARFTHDIVKLAQDEEGGCEGRVISVLEGGYSDRALCSGVMSHLSGLCAQSKDVIKNEAFALDDMMNGLQIQGTAPVAPLTYDKTWWSAANLTALEQQVNPAAPPALGKKVRAGPQPTYATPTESFAYKVVDPTKFARSISGTMREVQLPPRAPTPPPPEVDWIVATQELSKLLIPSDRQTKSCTPEELSGVRMKKESQSAMPVLSTSEEIVGPRQLRDRKSKLPSIHSDGANGDELESLRSVSRSSNRRQTMHELPSASSEPAGPPAHQPRRASRRLSSGSILSSSTGELDPDAPPVPALPIAPPRVNGAMMPPAIPKPRSAGNGVQIKKTRAPSKPRKVTAPSSAPVSPAVLHAPTPSTLPAATRKVNDDVVLPNTSELDSLNSAMKRITLKLGPREEHDRKQEEKLAAERRARGLKAAETRRVNAAAKKAAAAQQQQSTGHMVPNIAPAVQQARSGILARPPLPANTPLLAPPSLQHPAVETGPGAGVNHALASQPPLDDVPVAFAPHLSAERRDTTRIEQPGQAAVASPPLNLGGAVHHLTQINGRTASPIPAQAAPNRVPASRPWSSPGNDGRKLPVFTSTSAIPFAAAVTSSPTSRTQPKSPWKHEQDVGDHVGDSNSFGESVMEGVQDDQVVQGAAVPANAERHLDDAQGNAGAVRGAPMY